MRTKLAVFLAVLCGMLGARPVASAQPAGEVVSVGGVARSSSGRRRRVAA